MSPNSLPTELRAQARKLVRKQQLPCTVPARIWGGSGSEQPCSLCGEVIREHELEFEIEERSTEGPRVFRFHSLCHAAWQVECMPGQS